MFDQNAQIDSDLNAAVPPYSYNPSAWSQRVPICILAGIATVIASYMALYQWRLIDSVWDPVFGDGTAKVLDSKVAQTMDRWIGIPDAALGAFAYLGDAVLGMAGSTRRWQYRPWLVLLFGIDVIPLGVVSSVLVILQGTVVGYWCFLCLVTAVISLILAYWAYDEVYVSLSYLWRVWSKTHSWRELGYAFCGVPSEQALAAGREIVEEAR
ncbi:vitamin K epoxide reductase [Aeoliella sp. ICT_H6.2]|uniref:Vitamin K epoxide reductase n=1 Tax=Aeoliella straminimaris TaxID=2954799 RepID=A0A9X2FJM5_9BACT|nr:vitamin K epoxide reductase family protein [Aeoliella straminimaris]MCO6047491.1 vitamin K epoxide reductase [Aeoliella straminimaris]